MKYLIDTDIIIYSIKGNATVQDNIARNKKSALSISVITFGELLFGARKSSFAAKNLATMYRIREIFPVLPIDNPVIETFGEIKAASQKSGKIVADLDLLIAATALTFNMTLVTNNIKHFDKIKGLNLENWSKKQLK